MKRKVKERDNIKVTLYLVLIRSSDLILKYD